MSTAERDTLQTLRDLVETISSRRGSAPDSSYTASLLSAGVAKCAQKTGEEAIEFVIAAVSGKSDEISQEAADLLYHLLVTLDATGVPLDDVLSELARRQGISGLDEKASRSES